MTDIVQLFQFRYISVNHIELDINDIFDWIKNVTVEMSSMLQSVKFWVSQSFFGLHISNSSWDIHLIRWEFLEMERSFSNGNIFAWAKNVTVDDGSILKSVKSWPRRYFLSLDIFSMTRYIFLSIWFSSVKARDLLLYERFTLSLS